MTDKRTPREVLAASRRKDSHEKRARVVAIVDEMAARGDAITFAGVAKTAGVSSWLVYAAGVREYIEAARKKQRGRLHLDAQTGLVSSPASLATDLELSRQQVTTLRAERDQLKVALQRQLGKQLDQIGTADLAARINELTRQNEKLTDDAFQLRQEAVDLAERLADTEDDLAAARSSLRRMIHTENTGP
ncbi:DUF6262 family protein [Nonomuraea sp. NPDC059007]|uniref:DUF6262 family protein n=1 Tax=Nonomuraea sp. NPDC059007 TaxID=3346692 RepID=UPI00368F0BF0